jgi:GH15 family glucan-1,4-alpha-glucosidase
MDLLQRSIDIILTNQHASGAYVACPTFPVYQFCWFRDAAYVAYALDLVGQADSAERFHRWAAQTILRHREAVQRGLHKVRNGQPLDPGEYVHTRYHLDGSVETDGEWPNFQIDGVGTWLWSLNEHHRFNGTVLSDEQRQAVELCLDYLLALWDRPCYDSWEERPDRLHTYTLSALHRGLACFSDVRTTVADVVSQIRSAIRSRAVINGHLIKDLDGADEVDGNLIAVAIPNGVFTVEHPVMRATIARIESDLRCEAGGVHRFAADTYYGGGEWVLLTAWLGWYYAHTGSVERARQLLVWIEAQADEAGYLPEQVGAHLNQPSYLAEWQQRWGQSARPLLWSHAAYLILRHAIDHTA